jgi:hypothetical protein
MHTQTFLPKHNNLQFQCNTSVIPDHTGTTRFGVIVQTSSISSIWFSHFSQMPWAVLTVGHTRL